MKFLSVIGKSRPVAALCRRYASRGTIGTVLFSGGGNVDGPEMSGTNVLIYSFANSNPYLCRILSISIRDLGPIQRTP